jgi:hypothetical protein
MEKSRPAYRTKPTEIAPADFQNEFTHGLRVHFFVHQEISMPNNNPQGHNQYTDDSNAQRKSSGNRQAEQSTGASGSRQQGQNERSGSSSNQGSREQQGDSSRRSSQNQR